MKAPLLCLFLVAASLATVSADTTPSTTGTATPVDTQGQRMEKFKAALEQLGLTDAQKAQIKQIRATVTDRRERRQQIMAVLTSNQKEKLRQMIMDHRDAAAAGDASGGT